MQERELRADGSFAEFFDRFNRDSAFQMSRVEFPLKGRVANLGDEGGGPTTLLDTVFVEEYWLKDFSYDVGDPRKNDFTRSIQVHELEAIVKVLGKENGLAATYQFQKVKGKWRLVWFEDMST